MVNIIAAALTDPGLMRDINEDRVWAEVYNPSEGEPVGLFIVCDGMGGHLGGECASHWATEAIKKSLSDYFCPKDPRATVKLPEDKNQIQEENEPTTHPSAITEIENQIRVAVQDANNVVFEYARNKPAEAGNAGTTVTLAFIKGSQAIFANVGDSRAYLIRNNQLHQITKDHSIVAQLVANHQLKPDEIYTHPQRNIIYRSLGQNTEVQIDTFRETLQPDDYLLLCSDGFWEMVHDDKTIVQLITSARNPSVACKSLIEAANKAGGEDNIGVVVVHLMP